MCRRMAELNDEIDQLEKQIEENIRKRDENKKPDEKKKKLRIEYKVFLFFALIFVAYVGYTVVFDKIIPRVTGERIVGKDISKEQKSNSIAGAVGAERPMVLSAENLQTTIDKMKTADPDIESVERASDSESPTIWIYVFNDGMRKDQLAAKYCDWFKSNNISVTSVMVLDNDAKKKGKLIELGEKRCM